MDKKYKAGLSLGKTIWLPYIAESVVRWHLAIRLPNSSCPK